MITRRLLTTFAVRRKLLRRTWPARRLSSNAHVLSSTLRFSLQPPLVQARPRYAWDEPCVHKLGSFHSPVAME